MELAKIPRMKKLEYDRLIVEEYMSRVAFKGGEHPHISPFLYIFDGKFIYFLSTKYGKKIRYFQENPNVTVEIERYSSDLSTYNFVTLSGRLVEVEDSDEIKVIREKFVHLIKEKGISKNFMVALGHSPKEPLENISTSQKNIVWKLVDVKEITGLAYPKT